jgi:intracellular multiplication protein IcmL
MVDTDRTDETQKEPAEITSPLIKLINAITGGKKKRNPSVKTGKAGSSAAGTSLAKKGGASLAKAGDAQNAPALSPELPRTAEQDAADDNLGPAVIPGGPLMTIVVRNEFYRDGFRSLLRIAFAEAVIIVIMVLSFIVYTNAAKSQDRYFATTADGRIMRLTPLNEPNMTTAALMSWIAQSSAEVMTFGFHDYQRRLQQSSRHFTRGGWESFTGSLNKSRTIESVEASQQVVTAQPRSAPVLIQEGVFNGKYRWVVDLPLTVVYKSGGAGSRSDNLNIHLVIDRVSSLENPNGVGIEQWVATQ